ncbi:MAG: CehA/McbA family metallohydrolase [Clostridiales bacterium]|nr:CehA/McbA family metallohydrolase [Clostridiales bacterium]
MNSKNEFGLFSVNTSSGQSAGGFSEVIFEFKPSADFVVNPRTMIEIVQFSRFYSNQFSLPQTHDPTAPGYVIAKRSDGKFISVVIRRIPEVYHRHGSTFHVIQLTLGETPLEKDGFIRIIYGFRGAGGPGTQFPLLAKSYKFPVFISQRHVLGGKRFMPDSAVSFDSLFVKSKNVSTNDVIDSANFNPEIQVCGGRPEKLKIIISPRGNDKALATVNVTDMHGNMSPVANGWVDIEGVGEIEVQSGFGKAYLNIKGSGLQRITGIFKSLNLSAVSNPFIMSQNVAWGEIHSHSGISDGLGSDEENYNSGITAGLDFGALSDHDTLMEKDSALWNKTVANAEKYKDEPDFTTLLGYESLAYHNGEITGHINIYYPDGNGEMQPRPELKTILGLCRKYGAIAIPHHTMYGGPFFDQMGMKMELLDPEEFTGEIMPVTEIYSTHGCSEIVGCERSLLGVNAERSVNAALLKGFKWGFIGGSDSHESLLGHNFRVDKVPRTINNEHMQFRHGITAAYVDEFTRKGVFNSLKRKSVYATTGERILLSFNINGMPIGSEVKIKSSSISRDIGVFAAGTSVISRIDIVRNGSIIHQRNPESTDCELLFIDEEIIDSDSYYYVKIIQADGEMAWSSPIWINVK